MYGNLYVLIMMFYCILYLERNSFDGLVQASQCTESLWLLCEWIKTIYYHSLLVIW